MKTATALALSFIHATALSTLAGVAAHSAGLHPLFAALVVIVAAGMSFFPIVRTAAMFGLLLLLVPFWKAVIVTALAAAVLISLESIGETMLKRQAVHRPRP